MAQGLTFTTTGKAVLGSVEPGWSQQEFATPVNPNEKAGGTGVVSFAAEDVAAGVLAINKAAVSTVDGLGSVSGTVRTTSKAGQRVTVTHDNGLARYNATRNMPPMIAASVPACLDLAEQMLGEPGFNGDSGSYWSLRGHESGFNAEGEQVQQSTYVYTWEMYNNDTGDFEQLKKTTNGNFLYVSEINTITAMPTERFKQIGSHLYASNLYGGSFDLARQPGTYNTATESPFTKLRIMGKTMLDGEDMQFALKGQPSGPADSDFSQIMGIQIDYSTALVNIFVDARFGGLPSSASTSFSIASLNLNAELAFRIYYTDASLTTAGPPVRYQLGFSLCNTSDYSTVVEGVLEFTPDSDPIYFDPWTLTGHVRAVWERTDLGGLTNLPSWPIAERQDWETARNYYGAATSGMGEPSIGFSGPVWDWLQAACSAYFWEIGLYENVVTARPVGLRGLDFTNFAPSPTLTPTTTRTGRSVDIVWQNAEAIAGDVVYNAREDDNRIISVNAAQETVTKIQTKSYLTSIAQPTRATSLGTLYNGTYYVIDSTGLPIVAGQWEDYGGALSVAIDSAEAGTIVVTLNGPREEIPSTTAPYSLAVSDGTNQYAALSIVGSGVIADPQTLNLLTGANPDITPQQVAFSVNNPFINSLEQAYDAGLWASVDAAGPRVSLDASVPTEILTGFGDTAGSLVQAFDSTYRIVTANVGRTATSLQAVRHATVGAFDDAWIAGDVIDHDAAWDGYLCEDQDVFPYLGSPAATLPPPVFPP